MQKYDYKNLLFIALGLSLPLSLFFTNYLFVLTATILLFNSPKRDNIRWLALIILLIPALIPILSILFHNEAFSLSSIEVKIPFVVVALMVGFTKLNDDILSKFKLGFIIGALLGGVFTTFDKSTFVSYLSNHFFLELTYASLYIVIALIYLWFTDIEISKLIKQVLSFAFLGILINTGNAFFITTGTLTVFAAIIIKGTSLQSKLAVGSLVVLFSLFIYKGNEIQKHLQKNNTHQQLSGVDKMAQWQCVLEIMQDRELFGVGFVSKETLLTDCYHNHSMLLAESNALNSHNEYLNAFLTLGYIGVLGMLIYFFKILFVAYDTKQVAQLLIIVLIALFSISENVFTRQKGVMITAITCLLIFSSKPIKIEEDIEQSTPTT